VLEALDLFEKAELSKPQIIFLNFNEEESLLFFKAINVLRKSNINCEMYPDLGKSNKQQKKQWKYVDNREIAFVVSKMEGDLFVVKNRINGEQINCNMDELIRLISK
ncbi:hypothetical protein MNBD_BACTEROID02-2015, partial [hydrothermal vent metagenome]